MKTTHLPYPKLAFEVADFNAVTAYEYVKGLPSAPLHEGLAKLLIDGLDPEVEIQRVVRNEDGEWHLDQLWVTSFFPGDPEMECITRVQTQRPGEPVKTDYYQVHYTDVLARGKMLVEYSYLVDENVRWLVTRLSNSQIAEEVLNENLAAVQRETFELLPEAEQAEIECPLARFQQFLDVFAESPEIAVPEIDSDD